MRRLLISMTALAVAATAVPAVAKPHDKDHQYVAQRDRRDFRDERSALRDERRDFRDERRDYKDARRDYKDARREYRQDARDWQRGRTYSYNHPDPRYNGYYADNYYRSGNYAPAQLSASDRIYRGNDNRYYCRRRDGTTGLIIGALGGGVLGNVIAPGGSKTLGSIIGGGLGAVVGKSIDRNNVTCR